MCRKFHDRAILQAEILRCIFRFFLYIISFGERMQRKTKALHNEHFIDNLLILKKKKKKNLRQRKRSVNISLKTIGLFV